MATKDKTLVAIAWCIKELTEYLNQKEVDFPHASRDLLEVITNSKENSPQQI